MRQMGEHRKQPKQHAKVAKPRTDRNKKEFQDTEGCGKFFIRDRKGTECGKGDHNHHDRTDQIRLYRCLSDDQSSHDSDGISHCTGKPHARLPQKFKRQFHDEYFHDCRKWDTLPRLSKRQK